MSPRTTSPGRHFSFKALAADDVVLSKYFLLLGQGYNVFNVTVDDLDEFLEELKAAGVKVLETNRLDDFDEVTPATAALPGDAEDLHPLLLPPEGSSGDDR